MKKNILIIITSLTFSINFAQSNFSNGFEIGYKKGFCHDQGISCIEPNSPIAPIPKVTESLDSYNDGYNRGFQIGLNKRKDKNSNSTSNGSGYKTTKATFIENKANNPYDNFDNVVSIANALKKSKGKALGFLQNKNYQAVADICFAGLRISPQDDEFMLLLGQAYKLSGDKKNGLKWLKKSSRLRPYDKNLKNLVNTLENKEISKKRNIVKSKNKKSKKRRKKNRNEEITLKIQNGIDKKLFSSADTDSNVKYTCPNNATIYLVKEVNEVFYQVLVDGYSGYLTRTNLVRD